MMSTAASVVKLWGWVAYICLLLLAAASSALLADQNIHAMNSVVPVNGSGSPNPGASKPVVDPGSNSNKNVPVASATNASTSENPSTSDGTTISPTKVTGASNALAGSKPVPKTSHVLLVGTADPIVEGSDAFSTVVYIVVGLTIVILAYMVVKNFRRRYASVRAERYGVRRRWRDQELQPLGKDDEDEDTLFEARAGIV